MKTTDDAVLGGRLRLLQPKRGHRVGHDAILLAAATGAKAGEHAVDFGAGVGAAGLALAVRVPGLRVTLVEIDTALCDLARENARRNLLGDRVDAVAADVSDAAMLAAAGLTQASIDHVFMNPPFNDASSQQSSPDAKRRLAHVAGEGMLPSWLARAAAILKPQGTVTLIWRAAGLRDVIAALAPAFGAVTVMSILPRPETEAIRVLVRGVKGGAGRLPDLPALVLNDAEGKPSQPAEAVLREAQPLMMATDRPAG